MVDTYFCSTAEKRVAVAVAVIRLAAVASVVTIERVVVVVAAAADS